MNPFQSRLVLVIALLLLGCSDDGTRPNAQRPGDVTGTVTRHKTGAGVPGVTLVLMDEGGVAATSHTDALGRFAFEGHAPGEYAVRLVGLELAGLDPRFEEPEPQQYDFTVEDAPVDLVFTILTLVPSRVTGTVTCGGAGVANASVRVVGGATDMTVTTNGQGQFAALELTAGNFTVFAEDTPCVLTPPYQVVNLRRAQAAVVELEG